MMLSTDDLIRILGPLAFRAADKFFKFVSWAIIIVGLRYAAHLTGEPSIRWLAEIAMTVFSTALVLQVIFLVVRDPETLGVPESLHTASRVAQVILGAGLTFVVASPFFFIDHTASRVAQVILGAGLTFVVASPFFFIDQIIDGLSQAQNSLKPKP